MVAPLVLLIANRDWFFTPEGYLDPWNYVGLFTQYLDPDYLPEDYKLGRLPWVLAGFLVHGVFPPVLAAYVLHAVFLCATSLALFVGLVALLRRPALAAVVAIGLAFYTPAHGSGGWDYHNTGAGALYLWTFALLALPSTLDGRRFMLVASGAMAALAIHTNITLVNFLPALALVYVCAAWLRTGQRITIRTFLGRAGWAALGALLATLALCLINWEVGRPFLFFGALLDAVVRFVGNPENVQEFHKPPGWVWTARYLAFPAAVAVAGIAFILISHRHPARTETRLAQALVLQFLAMALLWVAWQAAGQITLDVDYFAYVLIPSCFIAVAGILSRRWPDWCERHWVATLLTTALVLWIGLAADATRSERALAALVAPVAFAATGALFLTGFAMVMWRPAVASLAILLVSVALGNRVVSGSPNYSWSDPCKVQPAVYGGIADAASWLMTDVDPLYTRVRIWFDEDEVLQPLADCTVSLGYVVASVTTMASMGYVSRAFPLGDVGALPAEALIGLTASETMLVIISNQSAALEAWRERLNSLGLVHEEISHRRVEVMESGFMMRVWKVQQRSP